MVALVKAAAYVISKAKNEGKLEKLGKTKIYKILYLADSGYFEKNNETLFELEWYRIQKGPALKSHQWEDLCQLLLTHYNVTSHWKRGYYPQIVFQFDDEILIDFPHKILLHLDSAYDDVIDLTAPDAANLTYDTEPMRWIVGHETALGNNVQFTEFRIDDSERIIFKQLAKDYMQEKIDIPKIAKKMGHDWTENRVIFFLELLQASRPLSKTVMNSKNRDAILTRLLELSQEDSNHYSSSKYVEAEVMASQRIEGINVSPDAFIEED